ncbi:hypothetical protein PG995_012768 [Apiospora arundinis]
MNALSNDAATTLLSAYKPEKSLATEKSSITTKSLTTTVVQYLPSGTTTEYRTTTATVSNGTLTSLTATTSPSPSSGVERDAGTGPMEDSLGEPPTAPPARPSAASANPAVVGGIMGTFGKFHHHPPADHRANQANRILFASSGFISHSHPHIHHAAEEETENKNRRRMHSHSHVRNTGVRAKTSGHGQMKDTGP